MATILIPPRRQFVKVLAGAVLAPVHKLFASTNVTQVFSKTARFGRRFVTGLNAAGKSTVQRGTAHWWKVPGPEPCTLAAILLDATVSK